MKSRRMLTFAFCALLVAPLLAQEQMRPGLWEITLRFELMTTFRGETRPSPFNPPPLTDARCVNAEEARTPIQAVWMVTHHLRDNPTCKVSESKTERDTLSWKEVCSDGVNPPVTGEGELLFNGDSFTGTVSVTIPPGTVGSSMPDRPNASRQYTGKRIGDC